MVNLKWMLQHPKRPLGALYYLGMEINKWWYRNENPDGKQILDIDWDLFVILDGCRYDMFPGNHGFDAELQEATSLGGNSAEFLNRNFSGETAHDIVYITANPHVYNLEDDIFHDTIPLLGDAWDDEMETVLPETVVETTIEAAEDYPNKRMMVHFMQPHYPFIGKEGRKLDHGGIPRYDSEGNKLEDHSKPVWWQLRYGELSADDVWRAYQENLDLVLPYVEELLKNISGRAIVSSDHGNLVGDRIGPFPTRGFGHPKSLPVKPLTSVPWLVRESNDRPRVISEPPANERRDIPQEKITERLDSLGYIS